MDIRQAEPQDSEAIIALWTLCGLVRSWNDPKKDIQRAMATWPDLFFVGEKDGEIIASAMSGYDGHRGAVYYFSVHPDWQGRGLGRKLMCQVEKAETPA